MNKKKITVLCALIIFSITLTGCSKVIDLTDDENRAIAEYCAELLLKYAAGYDDKYYEGKDADTTPDMTTEEIVTTQETVTTQESAQTTTQVAVDQTEATTTQPQTTAPAEQTYETDVAKILGIDKVSIPYQSFQITDRYPSRNKDGELIYLEASEGMKLIVAQFSVNNLTTEQVKLDLLSMDASYRIVMNQTKSAKSMLTILMDDLSTYEATLAASASEEAVLVFQIADNLVDQIKTLDVKVIYGEHEGMIKLQ